MWQCYALVGDNWIPPKTVLLLSRNASSPRAVLYVTSFHNNSHDTKYRTNPHHPFIIVSVPSRTQVKDCMLNSIIFEHLNLRRNFCKQMTWSTNFYTLRTFAWGERKIKQTKGKIKTMNSCRINLPIVLSVWDRKWNPWNICLVSIGGFI